MIDENGKGLYTLSEEKLRIENWKYQILVRKSSSIFEIS
jgi:hypothetical protein